MTTLLAVVSELMRNNCEQTNGCLLSMREDHMMQRHQVYVTSCSSVKTTELYTVKTQVSNMFTPSGSPKAKRDDFINSPRTPTKIQSRSVDINYCVCRVMWNSKEKWYMKDIFITQLDSELQTLCSTKNSSVLSKSNGEELLQFSLEKFDSELQSNAPITNKVLECLCASSRQKKKKRASEEM